MDGAQLEAMTEDQILDAAGCCADTIRDAETDLLQLAYRWAIVHSADRLDPATAALPGREQARRYGGAGTPEVTEFAAAAFGARIGRSTYAARQLIADALDLQHRHRQLWVRVQAGEVRASYARHVCAKTRDLTREQAAYVDAAVAESADGRITWSRFEALVEAKVAQAAPEVARGKEERAARATFARKTANEAHGMASFLIRGDLATIDRIDAAVTAKAAESESEGTDDERRVRAVLELLCGPDSGVQVMLYVHTYAGPDREPIARVEGHGPVTEEWVRSVLGPQATFTILPVFDIAGQAPVDAYEIPDRHKQAVHLMTPADTFPYASSLSRDKQVDHTRAHAEGGVSEVGNYGPMTIIHHRIKTHGGWQVQQPFPGIYVWRDPYGAFYLVDHTGTRRIPSAPEPTERSRAPRPSFEMWHVPFELVYEPAA